MVEEVMVDSGVPEKDKTVIRYFCRGCGRHTLFEPFGRCELCGWQDEE